MSVNQADGSYWIPGSYLTRNSMSAGSNAWPRFLAWCTNAPPPRESSRGAGARPRWGRSPRRHRAHHPSLVCPWTVHQLSPSASLAYAPRPWLPRFWSSPQPPRRVARLSASVDTRVPGAMVSWRHGALGWCRTGASRLRTTGPPRGILPTRGGLASVSVPRPRSPLPRCRRPCRPLALTATGGP